MSKFILAVAIVSHACIVSAGPLPDPVLTPGDVRTTDTKYVCTPGTSQKDRRVTESAKRRVFASYGVPGNRKGICGGAEGCEVDHLISLQLGGSNSVRNLWPQPYEGEWNAHQKDVLESKLKRLVCSGTMPLEEAQYIIANDWISAYKQYVVQPRNKK